MGSTETPPTLRTLKWSSTIAVCLFAVGVIAWRRYRFPHTQAGDTLLSSGRHRQPPPPTLSELRQRVAALSAQVNEWSALPISTAGQLDQLAACLERYAIDMHGTTSSLQETCLRLAHECVLTLDHLDALATSAGEETLALVGRVRKRVARILESVNLQDIPVVAGSTFDIDTQTPVFLETEGPDNVVLSINRKGYAITLPGRGRIVVRRPEVVVGRRG